MKKAWLALALVTLAMRGSRSAEDPSSQVSRMRSSIGLVVDSEEEAALLFLMAFLVLEELDEEEVLLSSSPSIVPMSLVNSLSSFSSKTLSLDFIISF